MVPSSSESLVGAADKEFEVAHSGSNGLSFLPFSHQQGRRESSHGGAQGKRGLRGGTGWPDALQAGLVLRRMRRPGGLLSGEEEEVWGGPQR